MYKKKRDRIKRLWTRTYQLIKEMGTKAEEVKVLWKVGHMGLKLKTRSVGVTVRRNQIMLNEIPRTNQREKNLRKEGRKEHSLSLSLEL